MIEKLKNKKSPETLDCIDVNIDGIDVHVYGILHGVFGGANKEYVAAVNETIAKSKGTKYCEKSMRALYVGLDIDVNDWLVLSNKEMFKFSFNSLINPRFWYHLVQTCVSEMTSKPKFGDNGIHTLPDAASSTSFHLMPPSERRLICGFPNAEEYLRLNILRREKGLKKKFRFADRDWAWLEMIEPNACIPLRSIHMIESAIYHAKKHGLSEISLFVGEIHNSDIEWYATVRDDEKHWVTPYKEQIQKVAFRAIDDKKYLKKRKLGYYGLSLLAGFVSIFPYAFLINYMINCV